MIGQSHNINSSVYWIDHSYTIENQFINIIWTQTHKQVREIGGGCVKIVSGKTDDAVVEDGTDEDANDSIGLSWVGFGDGICFAVSFTAETTELIGGAVTVEDVTSHVANVANGCCCESCWGGCCCCCGCGGIGGGCDGCSFICCCCGWTTQTGWTLCTDLAA